MKVLMVGSGAVGQVLAYSLQKANVTIGLLDQPAGIDQLKKAKELGGLLLHQITRSKRKPKSLHRLTEYLVLEDIEQSQSFEPDQIWFTTPSTVYYTTWFQEFLQQIPSARIVCFIPEGRRQEFLPIEGSDRFVFGGITFMAWQGSMEVQGKSINGIHFWLSPISIPLTGKRTVCNEVATLLRKAGFHVKISQPNSSQQGSVTAIMTTFMAGLELVNWSLAAYPKNKWLKHAAYAAVEAVQSQNNRSDPKKLLRIRKSVYVLCFWMAAKLLPFLFPFDLEGYLKFHYTKTHHQTLFLLNIYILDSEQKGNAVLHLPELVRSLDEKDKGLNLCDSSRSII